jgi:hypothetical protein
VRPDDYGHPRIDWRFIVKLPICFVGFYLYDRYHQLIHSHPAPNTDIKFLIVVAILLALVWTFVYDHPRANFELEIGENYIVKRDVGDSDAEVIERRDLKIKECSAGIFNRLSGLEITYPTLKSYWFNRGTMSFFVPETTSEYSRIKAELLRQS